MSFLKNIFNRTPKRRTNFNDRDNLFLTYQQKIYPWVKVLIPIEDSDEKISKFKNDDIPIFKPWLGDLIISYVIDMGHSFQVILKRDLPKSVSEEDLHKIAIDNLIRDIKFTLRDTNFGGHMLTAGGNHEAGAICSAGLWEWLAGHLSDSLVVAIPSKDLILIIPKNDTDKVDNLKIFVQEIFKTGDRLLTRNIFEYNKETKEWTIVDQAGDNVSRYVAQ